MTTPNPHLPDSHPAPGYPPEYAAPTQWDAQPMNGAMGQGYVPDAQHGYWGQEPAPRPKKRRSIGGIILTAFGTVIIVASTLAVSRLISSLETMGIVATGSPGPASHFFYTWSPLA